MDDVAFARFLNDLRSLPGTWVADPAAPRELDRVQAFVGVRLPPAHRAVLLGANGFQAGWGYLRCFGVGDGTQDVGPWNAHETWKFAWPVPLEDYLCIGQTGWGDQFAYKLSDLRHGLDAVYRLDHFLMQSAAEPAAPSFGVFLAGLLRQARTPPERIAEARRQLGDLPRDELAVFSPSPLLVGLERATQLKRMAARDAMILSGDLAAQLTDVETETRSVDRFETYLDERGRARVKIHWAQAFRPVGTPVARTAQAGEPAVGVPGDSDTPDDLTIADPELPWL
jgi:hypothetical protein